MMVTNELWRERAASGRALRRVPQLAGLSRTDLSGLAHRLGHVQVPAGTEVCRRGDPAQFAYLVARGELSTGLAYCGEEAVANGQATYRSTVTAATALQLWTLDRRDLPESLPAARRRTDAGVRIDVHRVCQRLRRNRLLLRDVSFSVRPGDLVAIVGSSGVGKTTLLETIAGVRPPSDGRVLYNGIDRFKHAASFRAGLGYVPQDDIIHRDLPLRSTLEYAARLRLPAGTDIGQIRTVVDEVLSAMDLSGVAATRVGSLSGGERKRASIAVELLTRPRVFFLDEPTSGLDPATGAEMMRLLRRLADGGSTVVLTTHNPSDVGLCDQVAILAGGGNLAFHGTPAGACAYFQTSSIQEIYECLDSEGTPEDWAERFRAAGDPAREVPSEASAASPPAPPRSIGPVRQWWVLTRRHSEILVRNRLTLALLVGSPAVVLLMFMVLFRSGAFDPASPDPPTALMILFWITFGGFFFGLTYGLLQICIEIPVLRRERLVNLRIGPYVLSKLALLLPLLVVVDTTMLASLRALDRLPAAGWDVYLSLGVTLVLATAAALALGLLVSAAVTDPVQATIALPMLCFPQVLFSGGILAVPVMAGIGRALSYAMSNRWAYEALGQGVSVGSLLSNGRSPLGAALLAEYGDSFSRPIWENWMLLGAFTAAFAIATCWTVSFRCRALPR